VIQGDNIDGAIAGLPQSHQVLPPITASGPYGYWQSKEPTTTPRTKCWAVAKEYRQARDPHRNSFQAGTTGHLRDWSGMILGIACATNPSLPRMMRPPHLNFHLATPSGGLGSDSKIYKENDKKGFLFKPSGWAGSSTMLQSCGQRPLLKYLKKGLYSKGIDGWWLDSTEPDIINALSKESSEYEMKAGREQLPGLLGAVSQRLPVDDHRRLYDHSSQRDESPAGLHSDPIHIRRTAAATAPRRVRRYRRELGQSIANRFPAGINHSMAESPIGPSIFGAFVLGSYGGVFDAGSRNPPTKKLYTRMFQLGAFSPIFRAHGSEGPREIWNSVNFSDAIVKADQWRYRLMPYIYSQAWQVTQAKGNRSCAAAMDFPKDTKTFGIDDQFLFGPSIMVCPVTEYMVHRPPETTCWFLLRICARKTASWASRSPTARMWTTRFLRLCAWNRRSISCGTQAAPTTPPRAPSRSAGRQAGAHPVRSAPITRQSFGARRLFLDGNPLPFLFDNTLERYTQPLHCRRAGPTIWSWKSRTPRPVRSRPNSTGGRRISTPKRR